MNQPLGLGSNVTIEGSTYTIENTTSDGGIICITLTSNLKGSLNINANCIVNLYQNAAVEILTTRDLTSILSPLDYIFISDDMPRVIAVFESKIVVTGAVTSDSVGVEMKVLHLLLGETEVPILFFGLKPTSPVSSVCIP